MAEPLLVSVSEVVNRMQLQADLAGIQAVIESAIVGAQVHVETVLDSEFRVQTRSSVFETDSDMFSSMQPGGVFRLYLPSGFVRGTPTVTFGVSPFGEQTDLVSPTLMSVDHVKGIVSVDAETYGDMFIRVEAETGFDLVGDPPDVLPDEVPTWLKEAILCYIPITLDVSQTTNRNAEAQEQYRRLADHAMVALSRHLRTGVSFCVRPLGV